MHLKPDSRPGDSPVAGAQGAVSLSDLSHLIAAGVYDSELRLIAEQAQMLTLASGAAIALRQDQLLVCRARAGSTAPALGARLDTQSGLSGECVRTARTLVCQDTESDGRVNLDVCRYLGIRSIAVLPICLGLDIVGVFEVFSSHPGAFTANEVAALESMRDLVISVIRPGPQAESPAFSALSARAAQEEAPALHAVATPDPEDDLLCEIEQRALPVPPPPRSASPPLPPPLAKQPPVLLTPSTPPPPPKAMAPAPPPPDPLARAVELLKSGSPAVFGPRPVPPFANPDPEDDLLCEIALRSAPQPGVFDPDPLPEHALSAWAPAETHPTEHAISRKLILAGVLVALAGVIWLRWCSHAQPAATSAPPPGSTVQAASTPSPAAATPPATAPAAAAESDAATAPVAQEAPASQPEGLSETGSSAPPRARERALPRARERQPNSGKISAAESEPPLGEVVRTPQPAAEAPSMAVRTPRLPAPDSSATLQPPSLPPATTPNQLAESMPNLPAGAAASPSAPEFPLHSAPAPAAPSATGRLSLSQAVVTAAAAPDSANTLSRDALRLLLDSAKAGDGGAQLSLGIRYANGEGVPQSYAESLKWFIRARKQGIVPSQSRAVEAWNKVQQWAQSHPSKK